MFRHSHILVLLRSLAALLCLGLPVRAEIQLTDILGRHVTLADPAHRIVLGEARHIAVLGLIHSDPVALVAGWRTDKSLDPESLKVWRARFPAMDAIAPVGSGNRGISVESVIALKPDLLVLSLIDAEDPAMETARDKIEAAGIPVIYVDFFSHPQQNSIPSLRILAKATGAEARAEDFARFYESHMAVIRDRLADPSIPRPSVFVHVHAAASGCCSTVGPGVFDDFVTTAGGSNIGRDVVKGVLGNVSLEFLLGADPDFYIATGGTHMAARGGLVLGAGVDEVTARKTFADLTGASGFSSLRAVEQGRAAGVWHLFNDSPIHIALIEYLAKTFHPDLFADVDPAATLDEIQARFLPVQVPGIWWVTTRP